MATITVDLALDAACDLGESPIWDDRTNTVYFVDINAQSVHGFNPIDGTHEIITLDEPAATVMLTDDPTHILVATKRDVLLVKFTKEEKRVVRSIATVPEEHGVDDMRFNDGKVSPQGVALLGRMNSKWRDGKRGRLYALDASTAGLTEVLSPEEVWLPNGLDWIDSTMYFACSGEEKVLAYEVDARGVPTRDPATGKLRSRVVADLSSGHKHVPDGLCLDSAGNVWVAPGESGTILCLDSKTGKVVQKVELPVKRPTACSFGGPGLDELYVTTRVETGPDASPKHGGLFRCKIPGVKGAAPAHKFKLQEWMKNNDASN